MSECKFKELTLIKTECVTTGRKRTYDDLREEKWKEKLWIAGVKNPLDVPSDITICSKHHEATESKFSNRRCCGPFNPPGTKKCRCIVGKSIV